jgi:phosphatidylserine/phosphatidylglycerophosphate/cardiolipin synthase-like enzyme
MTAKYNHRNKNWLWLLILLIAGLIYLLYPQKNIPESESQQTDSISHITPTVAGISTNVPAQTITAVPSDNNTWYKVYFTNPKIPFDGQYSDGIAQYLIQQIDASQTSIDVAVYEFSLEDVAQALIRAKDRGVDVRVVYDNEFADPDPQIGEVKAAGIPAVPDNRKAFMHNKFFVFDDDCIWTGSFNISVNAANKNNENALYFCSPEAADNYDTEFNEMFVDKEFGSSSPSDTPYPIFTVDGIKIENYFASEDHVMAKVIAAVSQAQNSIHFMTYSFTDDDLGQEMITKAAEGVKVEGIFETVGANTQYSECNPLLKDGLDVRLDGNPATFHHKVIIIDDQTVILGSFNFTSNADTQNDENLLIVHDPSLASAYEQQYQLMKSQAVIPFGTTCKK